jgi:hypothetical protein
VLDVVSVVFKTVTTGQLPFYVMSSYDVPLIIASTFPIQVEFNREKNVQIREGCIKAGDL